MSMLDDALEQLGVVVRERDQLRRELSAVAAVRDSLKEQNAQLEQRVAELESELAKRTAPSTGRPYPLE